jgi:hypothetical protein
VAMQGVTKADLPKMLGTYDMGWNTTGVIRSFMHVSQEEIVLYDEMPGCVVEDIMAEVAAMSDAVKRRGQGMECVGKLPLPIWALWRRQWEKGPKGSGVIWGAFLKSKLMDSDFSRFRVRK